MTHPRSSANTLVSIPDAAEAAGISRQTLHNWIAAEPPVVRHTYSVKEVPVFTKAEVAQIVRVANERREARSSLLLSKK